MGRAIFLVALLACSSRTPADELDAGNDSGADAGNDASSTPDTGVTGEMDTGFDTGFDAGFDAGPLTGDSFLYVLDVIDLGVADAGTPTIVPGFDLDGVVSDGTEVETCRKQDFTSPPPDSLPGVDNELGPLLASQEASFNIRANLAGSVRAGRLLVMLEIRGVDDLVDDDRVVVDVLFGVLPAGVLNPMISGARFVPGQTFDIDMRSLAADGMTALVSLPGRIVSGRLQAGPGSLGLSVPFGAELVLLQLDRVQVRADITATTLSRGILGGALDVEETSVALAPVTDLTLPVLRLVLGGAADLDRGGGSCTAASLGLVFDGIQAVEGVVVTP